MTKVRVGGAILIFLLIFSLIFMSKGTIDYSLVLEGVSLSHPFGCDTLGRDLLGRVSYGLIVSLFISFTGSSLAIILGLILLFLRSKGGLVGTLSFSLTKALRTIPSIILALFLYSIRGARSENVIIAIAFSGASNLAIFLFPLLKGIEKEQYVEAAVALGLKKERIFFKYIILSLLPYIKEEFFLSLVLSIITESSLSFLSCALDPSVPTIGRILAEARAVVLTYPHTVIFPSVVLIALSLSFFLISRGFSELNSPLHRS